MRSQTPVREKKEINILFRLLVSNQCFWNEENGAILKIISNGVLTEMTHTCKSVLRQKDGVLYNNLFSL